MIGLSKNFAASMPFVAYSSFATPFAAISIGSAGSLTTNQVTINVSGGSSPFTYSWLKVSGDDITVSSSTSNQVTFNASGFDGQEKTAQFRCTVTDSLANTVSSDVTTFFQFGDQL